MLPIIQPPDIVTGSIHSKLTSLFDAESLLGVFADSCETKKDITDQIPQWVVFEKEELIGQGKTPITIFDLLQKYYDWLYCDSTGGSEYQLGLKLLDLIDIDKTREIYVGRLASIYAEGLSHKDLVPYGGKIPTDNVRKFIHSVRKNFHQKKTTIDGIRYFFKTLFDIPQDAVKVEYPKKYLLRLNGGRFFNENFSFPGGTGSYEVLQALSGSCLNFSRIQDGNFYQDYSYLLKVGMVSSYYKDTYKTLTHPAGLKIIYEKTLEDYDGPQTDYESSDVCERTFLRNYAPYGISQEYTDIIGNYQSNVYYGLPYCTGCCATEYGEYAAPTFAFPNWTKTNITGYNFKEIPLSYFFDLCYDVNEVVSPNLGLTCTTCTVLANNQYNIVFKYLIHRYESGWSAATENAGKDAMLTIMGVSAPENPFNVGGAIMNAYQYVANPGTSGASAGWFDPFTHPRTFATAVKTAYRPFERARSPQKANNKFIDMYYSLSTDIYYDLGGPANTFFNLGPKFRFASQFSDPERPSAAILSLNLEAMYANGIARMMIHSPYGRLATPQSVGSFSPLAGAWRSLPWLTRNYAGTFFRFDQYLLMSEKTTIRDLLNAPKTTIRNESEGILVNGVGDIHINTQYSTVNQPVGSQAVFEYPFNTRDQGYTQTVSIGSPWIPMTPVTGITWSGGWWSGETPVMAFDERTMVMNNGSAFSVVPPNLNGTFNITNIPFGFWNSLSSNPIGLSYTFGKRLILDLDAISADWSDKIEFIAYLGNMPYGHGEDFTVPLSVYKDPTNIDNVNYTKWRLDASVSHWKTKFKSPHDGFAHVYMEGALVPRTFHMYQGPDYTTWTNIAPNGLSYVESIPITWLKDQYEYTRGNSPDPDAGVIMGQESFAQYMFIDDLAESPQHALEQSRYLGDPKPRHWSLDEDIAADLQASLYDMCVGQRKRGFTYSDSIWKRGVCGTSDLGEILCDDSPLVNRPLDGYPFFHNSFIEYSGGILKYKGLSGTNFFTGGKIPWNYDRRFRLFYLYPTMLALNLSILEHLHSGPAYFGTPFAKPHSPWYDVTLGLTYTMDMESNAAPYDPSLYVARNPIWAASLAPTDNTIPPTTIAADDMGAVNTYTYIKPAIHVFDCAVDGGYENSTAIQFINGIMGCSSRFSSIVSKLMELPAGQRMYYLTRYNQGPIYNEVGDRYGNGKQSPWADEVGITLTNDWTAVANALVSEGAVPDYISMDCEQSGPIFNFKFEASPAWTDQVYGITSDSNYTQTWNGSSSFDTLATDSGSYAFSITDVRDGIYHPQLNKSYLYWDRAVSSLHAALLKSTITDVAIDYFGSAISVSNYGDALFYPTVADEVYEVNGHPMIQNMLAGDASSPILYGGWKFPDAYGILVSDPTRIVRKDYLGDGSWIPFGDNAWNQLLMIIQTLRIARKNTAGKVRPYIASRSFSDSTYPTYWTASSYNLKLYNEMVRHCCLTGIESFILFNSFDSTESRNTGLASLETVLADINTRLGGYISKTANYAKINLTSQVLISGAPTTHGTYLWRITPNTDVTISDSDDNILITDSDGGVWMETTFNQRITSSFAPAPNGGIRINIESVDFYPVVSNTPFANRRTPLTPPQNYWTGTPDSSEFELLYACMKGGITMGLDSLGFDDLFVYLYARGATGFE